MKSQPRAYKVNHNYGKSQRTIIVGGAKAGRYFQAVEKRRRAVRLDSKKRTISENWKLIKKIWQRGLIITYAIAMLACAFQVGINHDKPADTQAAIQDEVPLSILAGATSFESVDPPADYKEPDLFEVYFKDEARIARAICMAESQLQNIRSKKQNTNGTYDHGVCQINDIHKDKVGGDINKLYDIETNIKVAKQIRDSWEGWHAWSCYKNGAYKKYL